ncbi:MAG: NAD(P)/FAD-dependent oxidoreductase [Planctomycetaceae bacterium]|nr:NAD(P)/FAD-dependent oxidoreductase [Planctomycetaceae bacterium]
MRQTLQRRVSARGRRLPPIPAAVYFRIWVPKSCLPKLENENMLAKSQKKRRVVIVGAGFAGLAAVKRLTKQPNLEIVLVDRNNYHTFQPLLYQVAAAELESEEIANPLRGLFRRYSRVSIAMADVSGVDFENRVLHTDGSEIEYDYLILAFGSVTNYFGTPGAEENTFTLKSLEDAVRLRNHILQCFEKAALLSGTSGIESQEKLIHIVVVGGGPTGVEYAGALAELIRTPLSRDFPEIPKDLTHITLLDACDDILPGFLPHLRTYAHKRLEHMGVEVLVNAQVKEVSADAVLLADGTAISSATVIWTAGVKGADLTTKMGLPPGRAGRVPVFSTLQLAAHPEVFVAGDLSLPEEQNPPMVAQNAVQQGRLAADNILRLEQKKPLKQYSYHDKGAMAVIGRNAAVARVGRFGFCGFLAWVFWLALHWTYLIGFHNRLFVLINWAWDYLFFERSVRLILPRRNQGDRNSFSGRSQTDT